MKVFYHLSTTDQTIDLNKVLLKQATEAYLKLQDEVLKLVLKELKRLNVRVK